MGIKQVFNSYLMNQINLICYLLILSVNYQELTKGKALCQAPLETKFHSSCPSGLSLVLKIYTSGTLESTVMLYEADS